MAGIKPDRADSGIDAALDIRGQAVPDDYCCFLMEIRDSGEAVVILQRASPVKNRVERK